MSSVLRRLHGVFTRRPRLPRVDLGKQCDLRKLVTQFKRLSESTEFRRRRVLYEKTVQRLAKHRQFALIEDLLEDQKQYVASSTDKFAVHLTSLYRKAGMFEHAQKLFDQLPSLKRDRSLLHLNALLAASICSKYLDKVDEIFQKLKTMDAFRSVQFWI